MSNHNEVKEGHFLNPQYNPVENSP